jgi:hypothetical protein
LNISIQPEFYHDELSLSTSLDYDIWSLILDDNGNPRLKQARHEFLPLTREKIPLLMKAYKIWSGFDEYLELENRKTLERLYVLCSKRGNGPYNRRLEDKLIFLKDYKDIELFSDSEFKSKPIIKIDTILIWLTLTFDTKLDSLDNAWDNDCAEYNLWITRLKYHYGEDNVHPLNFIQPFPGNGPAQGYPHHHVLLLIENHDFHVHRDMEEENNTLKMVYRLDSEEEKELLEAGNWHSPQTDVKVLRNGQHVYNYCFKYVQNVVTGSCWPESEDPSKPGAYEKSLITNSILWLKRKRAFTMGGDFRVSYSRLIRALHNSKPVQVNFEGEEVPIDWNNPPEPGDWRLVGMISGDSLREKLGRAPRWVEVVPGT